MENVQAYNVPFGLGNLKNMVSGVKFSDITAYVVQVVADDNTIIMTTPIVRIPKVCPDKSIVVYFLNSVGGIDSFIFQTATKVIETKSSSWMRGDMTKKRYNVTGTEKYTATSTIYFEDEMRFAEELFTSPKAWMSWESTEGGDPDYLPIIIDDGKIQTVKEKDRYIYEVQLDFSIAKSISTQRG